MGDPRFFSVIGGANPHTRTAFGRRKRVDPELAREQWHELARNLVAHGVEVCVVEPHEDLSGLVYPANAGFLYPLTGTGEKTFYLSHLLPTRAPEREVYRPFLENMGYRTASIRARFEGEADFFPAGHYMLFTYGGIERQRFVPRLGWPPWKRVYGFRSEIGALDELRAITSGHELIPIRLCRETHYHGDTVLCSFGPGRKFLMAYMEALAPEAGSALRGAFGNDLIELSAADAEVYAANSFQTDLNGKLYLFMPEGVSAALLEAVRARGVEPVTSNVSEFLAKGGGSIKCMVLDLGPTEEQPEWGAGYRVEHSYLRLYGA